MSSDQLVKAFLMADSCELFDRSRISCIFKNLSKKYGKYQVNDTHLVVSFSTSKTRKMVYYIPLSLITKEQFSILK